LTELKKIFSVQLRKILLLPTAGFHFNRLWVQLPS